MDLFGRIASGRSRSRLALASVAALAVVAGGCSWSETEDLLKGRSRLERSHADHSVALSKVRIGDARFTSGTAANGGAVLSFRLDNATDDPLWVRLDIVAERPEDGCEDTYEIKPVGHLPIECPQKFRPDGASFAVEITVYKDIGHLHTLETANVQLVFGAREEGEIRWE